VISHPRRPLGSREYGAKLIIRVEAKDASPCT
jgi:hypothetical protein